MVEKDATEDRALMCHLRGIIEPGLSHEGDNRLSRVIPHVIAAVKQAGENPVRMVMSPAKIKQMQGTAGLEDTPYLAEASLLLVALEVMEHEG